MRRFIRVQSAPLGMVAGAVGPSVRSASAQSQISAISQPDQSHIRARSEQVRVISKSDQRQ
eukprot:8465274-Lingulodinium_polyedra.AAC.1